MKKKLPITIVVMFIADMLYNMFSTKVKLGISQLTQGYTSALLKQTCLFAIIMIAILYISRVYTKRARVLLINRTDNALLERVLNSKMSEIQNVSTGKIFDAVKDIASIGANIRLTVLNIVPTIIPFAVLVYKEWQWNHWMAVISTVSITVGIVMTAISDKLFKWNTAAKDKKAMLQSVTVDNFLNVRTLKFIRKKRFAQNRLIEAQNEAMPYMVRKLQFLWWRITDVVSWTPLLANIYLARNNVELIATIVVLDSALDNMWGQVAGLIELVIEYNAQRSVIAKLKGDDVEQYAPMGDQLVLHDLEFGYEDLKFQIEHLEFDKGSRYVVTGESGQGKSTLANLISGVIVPTKGSFEPVSVFYVWQETEMFNATLKENLVFDNDDQVTEDELLQLFTELNMTEWFHGLPNGFNTQIGERGCKLSSGQKQRINIIRTILHMRAHPEDLFVVDEITSNLDSVTRDLAIRLINRECKSTLVAISHNDGFEKICDHHIVVENHRFEMIN